MPMAVARQRAGWLRAGVAVAWVVNRNGWTRQAVSPLDVIPPQFRPPVPPEPEKSPEQLADESRRAWHVLDRYFGGR